MVKWKYIGSLLRLYIYVQSVKTYNWIVHEYECLLLALSFFKLRERESGKRNLGVKEKCPQSYLSFSTGFHWRIFLLSRANRLRSVFSTGLKDFGVPRVSVNLLSLARSKNGYGPSATSLAQKTASFVLYFRWGEGNPTSVLGSQPVILASLSFPFRCPATWGHLSANIWSPVWPTFLPTGHFLTAWYSNSIREDSISLTSSSPWAITWHNKKLLNDLTTIIDSCMAS